MPAFFTVPEYMQPNKPTSLAPESLKYKPLIV